MNLKERGITVGDLLIILLIIVTTILVAKKFDNKKETAFNLNTQEVTYKNIRFLLK